MPSGHILIPLIKASTTTDVKVYGDAMDIIHKALYENNLSMAEAEIMRAYRKKILDNWIANRKAT